MRRERGRGRLMNVYETRSYVFAGVLRRTSAYFPFLLLLSYNDSARRRSARSTKLSLERTMRAVDAGQSNQPECRPKPVVRCLSLHREPQTAALLIVSPVELHDHTRLSRSLPRRPTPDARTLPLHPPDPSPPLTRQLAGPQPIHPPTPD